MRDSETAIAAEGVVKRYGAGRRAPANTALDGLDLRVARGSVHGLLGPNGAGKTTAVRVMTTLVEPDAGRVVVAGHDAGRRPREVRRRIGLVGQHAAVDDILTGRQNLTLFARLNGFRAATAARLAGDLLDRFDLAAAADRPVSTYSGGMRRRVDLAAGLITAPEVLFVDEPTTGLDPGIRQEVWDAIRELVRTGTTVLLTTQYLEEADQLADRVSLLGRGRVAAEGTPAELKARVGDDWLVVTPAAGETAASCAAVLADWASGPVGTEDGKLLVPLPDRAGALVGAVAALRDAGLPVADIAVRTPSLDEVFIQVTGDSAVTTEESGAATGGPAASREGARR
ncbi:ATP-binding cassette domain-containing protein [Nocardiopsis coralliicola]